MDAATCWSYSRPSAISCDSLTSMNCRAPVAGFTAQPANESDARSRGMTERIAVRYSPPVPLSVPERGDYDSAFSELLPQHRQGDVRVPDVLRHQPPSALIHPAHDVLARIGRRH